MNFSLPGYRFACAVIVGWLCSLCFASGAKVEQNVIEAAMTLQLLNFTEWQDSANSASKQRIQIGIYEDAALFEEFQTLLERERFRDRFSVVLLAVDDNRNRFDSLDALFFSESDPREVPRLIKRLENRPIVLIGSFDGFLEMGGMVNFTIQQKRLGFEIDVRHAREHGIEFRAKLLRLATRVIDE